MILVHEFGHYAAAKLFGVRVDVFSIGFGKRLVGFRRGDTDYRISALPLGGYVKMAGEIRWKPRSGAPEEFMSHPRWQRFIIAIAGPAMNILLAVGLLTGVYMVHYERPALPRPTGGRSGGSSTTHRRLKPASSQATASSESMAQNNPTWEDVLLKVMISPKQPVDVAVQRDNQILEKQVSPERAPTNPSSTAPSDGCRTNRLRSPQLDPNMPAAKAEFSVGDQIVAINGTPVRSARSRSSTTSSRPGQAGGHHCVRGGQQSDVPDQPDHDRGERPEADIASASSQSRCMSTSSPSHRHSTARCRRTRSYSC